jgi:transposase
MLYAGLDLSRHRLDVHLMNQAGEPVQVTTAPPDVDGLRGLARQTAGFGEPVVAAIESMNGARFVHDQLELAGWEVQIADAQKVKGLAPLACKTDRIDAWVLAELSRRDLVPEIWLPTPEVRAERERARFRLHLVRHRTALKNRIHATLLAFGKPCPVSDLFGAGGRALLARLTLPEPWISNVAAALALIDDLDDQIDGCECELRRLGADHPYVPLLRTAPGSPGCWATPSPPRWATSPGSHRPRSCVATPGCARGCTSPAAATSAAHWPRTARRIFAGP